MGKTTRRYKKRDEVASSVAKATGLSYRYVKMVSDGDREDEIVLEKLVEYTQGLKMLRDSIRVERAIERHAKSKRKHASKAH